MTGLELAGREPHGIALGHPAPSVQRLEADRSRQDEKDLLLVGVGV